jgi:hypothetical protein
MSTTVHDLGPQQTLSARVRTVSPQRINEIGLAVVIVVVATWLTFAAPGFATEKNFFSIMRDAATVGIVAWGATLVIVAGEIDISVGPAVAFWSVMLAEMAGPWGLGLTAALVITLIGGLLVGALAGWLRASLGIPSFIATLGLWSAYRGLAQFTTNALPVPVDTDPVLDLLAGSIGPIPTSVVVLFLLFVIFYLVSTRTSFGRCGRDSIGRRSGVNARHPPRSRIHRDDRQRPHPPRRELLHSERGQRCHYRDLGTGKHPLVQARRKDRITASRTQGGRCKKPCLLVVESSKSESCCCRNTRHFYVFPATHAPDGGRAVLLSL